MTLGGHGKKRDDGVRTADRMRSCIGRTTSNYPLPEPDPSRHPDTKARELIHHVPGQRRKAKTPEAHPSERAWWGSGVGLFAYFGKWDREGSRKALGWDAALRV